MEFSKSVPTLPIPMMLHFPLSPSVIVPLFFQFREQRTLATHVSGATTIHDPLMFCALGDNLQIPITALPQLLDQVCNLDSYSGSIILEGLAPLGTQISLTCPLR